MRFSILYFEFFLAKDMTNQTIIYEMISFPKSNSRKTSQGSIILFILLSRLQMHILALLFFEQGDLFLLLSAN